MSFRPSWQAKTFSRFRMKRRYKPLDLSREDLLDMLRRYEPAGSGPLGVMLVVCQLVETVAVLKGIDLSYEESDG